MVSVMLQNGDKRMVVVGHLPVWVLLHLFIEFPFEN